MIRFILAALLIICCAGCGVNRQYAADSIAGIKAAQDLVNQGQYDAAKAVLDAAIAYELGAIDLPMADMPKPTYAPAAIAANPGPYIGSAPPEPKPWGAGMIAGLSTAALAALFGVRKIAPMVPGMGPLVGGIADGIWGLLAHAEQKKADAVADTVVAAARQVKPVIAMLTTEHAALPESVRAAITPERLAALATIVATLADDPKPKAGA